MIITWPIKIEESDVRAKFKWEYVHPNLSDTSPNITKFDGPSIESQCNTTRASIEIKGMECPNR